MGDCASNFSVVIFIAIRHNVAQGWFFWDLHALSVLCTYMSNISKWHELRKGNTGNTLIMWDVCVARKSYFLFYCLYSYKYSKICFYYSGFKHIFMHLREILTTFFRCMMYRWNRKGFSANCKTFYIVRLSRISK